MWWRITRRRGFRGQVGFVLKNPRPLETPIPIKGALGFWEIPEDATEEIRAQLGG